MPLPASVVLGADSVVIGDSTAIVTSSDPDVSRSAWQLAVLMRASTGFAIPVVLEDNRHLWHPHIVLDRVETRTDLGAEGYELTSGNDTVRITAATPAGIFYGTQTLRQMLPPAIESQMSLGRRWAIPAVRIHDVPRFAWRGSMLDVARHFFSVDEVKEHIDLMALYKLNVLHLHLSDDQGWRIEIASRPNLVRDGSITEVGGGPGGFYTQADYREIVSYASTKFITIVPEIDMPAHINAALTAYRELSCGRSPAPYSGVEVGFSAICPEAAGTWRLLDDVVRELSAMTPGPYLHIGGDEVQVLTREQYVRFISRANELVAHYGKRMIGWQEVRFASLREGTLVQQWQGDTIHPPAGTKLIVSPGPRMYFDMKYTPAMELGLTWAGTHDVRDAYDWDPAKYNPGVADSLIVGVEAPLWSETVRNITAAQQMLVPRLPAMAELAWSPQSVRSWNDFRVRIATHAPRWRYLGINYDRSPQIPW